MSARFPASFTAAMTLFAVVSLAGCGGGASEHERVVVHVGKVAIGKDAVVHWTNVLQGGQAQARVSSVRARALRDQALELLISRWWLIGEAVARGIVITGPQVRQQMDRTARAEFPEGAAERREFLKATGETVSDLEFQASAELASAKLYQLAMDRAPAVTQAQLAGYYAAHKHNFLLPERREARFSNLKHRDQSEKLKREVEAGKSLTSPAQRRFHEVFTSARVPPGNPWEKAIDSSKPHVVSGPYNIQSDYLLYEVVRIIPARQRTLAEVGHLIRRKLINESRQKALASLVRTWRKQWTARTDCRPGYVVQRCRQYTGPVAAEDLFAVQ